jgi:hypothetical protein
MSSYMIYQMVRAEQIAAAGRAAERAGRSPAPGQAAAQREADARLGETAAAVAQLFRGVTRPVTAVRAAVRHWRPTQPSPGQPSPGQAGRGMHITQQR